MAAGDRTCFVIAPIGEDGSDVRKRSDQVLKHVIRPAAEACGYTVLRADQIAAPGIITSQVIQHVLDDPMVVADLTGHNPNVFYELAVRHAVRRPLVQLIQKGEPIPFDVAATRTVQVDHHDMDSVEEAKAEITRQMQAAEKDAQELDSPISVAIDRQVLQRSGNPVQEELARLSQAVAALRVEMGGIMTAVSQLLSGAQEARLGKFFGSAHPEVKAATGPFFTVLEHPIWPVNPQGPGSTAPPEWPQRRVRSRRRRRSGKTEKPG